MEHPTELTPHPVLGRHALPLLPPTCHGRDNGFHNINKKHTGNTILASRGEGGTPNGTTSLQQPCSPQALTLGCVDAPGSHSRALVQHFTKNIFFKYSSKPKPTFSGVESSNSETICPGLMMWCLPSGIIKIPSGGRWQLKNLPTHCQFTAVVHVSCPTGQATLLMPRTLAPGKPLKPARRGRWESSC